MADYHIADLVATLKVDLSDLSLAAARVSAATAGISAAANAAVAGLPDDFAKIGEQAGVNLGEAIAGNIREHLAQSNGDLEKAGEGLGETVSRSVGDGLKKQNLGSPLLDALKALQPEVEDQGTNLGDRVTAGYLNALEGLANDARQTAEQIGRSVDDALNNSSSGSGSSNLGQGLLDALKALQPEFQDQGKAYGDRITAGYLGSLDGLLNDTEQRTRALSPIFARSGQDAGIKFTGGFSGSVGSGFSSAIDKIEQRLSSVGGALSSIGKFDAFAVLADQAISLVGAIAPISAALLAIPAAASVAAAGIGSLLTGLSGVTGALKAAFTSQPSSGGGGGGGGGESAAEKQLQLQEATQGVTRAQEGLAAADHDVQAAGQRVIDATNGVTSAQRQAADAAHELGVSQRNVQQATQGVADAQEGVTLAIRNVSDAEQRAAGAVQNVADAQHRATEAEQALTQARQSATQTLQNYGDQLAQAANNEEDADTALLKAQANLQNLEATGTASALDLRAARDQLADAELRYQEAVKSNAQLQQTANAAQLAGVDGNQQVIQAKDSLAQANENVTSSQQAATLATRDVADANDAVVKAQQGVVQAQQQVEDANYSLAQSQQNVVDSQNGIISAQQNLADAQYGVIQANQHVADSQAELTDAQARLTLAQTGGAGASGAAATAANKYAAALAKLSPNARATVEAIVALRGQFEAIRKDVQDDLFAGLDVEVKQLASASFPTLQRGMEETATSINHVVKAAADSAETPLFQGNIAKIFDATSQSTENLSRATGPLVIGLSNLAVAGLPLVERFSNFSANALTAAGNFLSSAAGAQKAGDAINRAGDAIAKLAQIAKNIGGAIGHIFDAAGLGNYLTNLEGITKQFDDFTKSAQGQQQISTIFKALAGLSHGMLEDLPVVFNAITGILSAFESLPQPVQNFIDRLAAFGLLLGPLVGNISGLVGGLKGIADLGDSVAVALGAEEGAFSALAGPVGLVVVGVGLLAAGLAYLYTKFKPVHDALQPVVDLFERAKQEFEAGLKFPDIKVVNTSGWEIFFKLGQDVTKTIDAIKKAFNDVKSGFSMPDLKVGSIGPGAAGPIDGTSWAFQLGQNLQKAIDQHDWKPLAQSIGEGIVKALDALTKFTAEITAALIRFLASVPWAQIGIAAGGFALDLAIGIIEGIAKEISDPKEQKKMADAGNTLAIAIIEGFLKGLENEVVEPIKFFSYTLPNDIVNAIKGALGIHSPSTVFQGIGQDTLSGFLRGLEDKLDGVLGFFRQLPGEISNALGNAGTWIEDKGESALHGLEEGANRGWVDVSDFFRGLPGAIRAAVGDLGGTLTGAGSAAIGGFKSGAGTAYRDVSGLFTGIRGDVLGWVKGPETWLIEAGKDVIKGLISGITNNSVINSLQNALQGVTNFIKDHKGPPSYDRVMLTPAGISIMKGLIDGIESQRENLRRTLRSVSTDIGSTDFSSINLSSQPLAVAGIASGAGGSSKPQNVEINNTLNLPVVPYTAAQVAAEGVAQLQNMSRMQKNKVL